MAILRLGTRIAAIASFQRQDHVSYYVARSETQTRHIIEAQNKAAVESLETREMLFDLIDDIAIESIDWQPDDWALNSPARKGE